MKSRIRLYFKQRSENCARGRRRACTLENVYSVDYVGATRAGMEAMLFDVAGAYRESGLPRVESLDELKMHLHCY